MSTHCVSMIKNLNLSLKIKEEEATSMEKQGIVSILDNVDSSSSNGEKDHHEKLKDQPIITFDWSSILSQKNEDSSNKLTSTSLYVHPLDKKSASYLSEKSLEICTESLGSETGSASDCFSSSPTSDDDEEQQQQQQQQQQSASFLESFEDIRVVKNNYSKKITSSPKSFPPSLPSVHMQSRRQNGRLILEAASVPSNSLHAQRVDGHLVLTSFINQSDFGLQMSNCNDEVEVLEQVFDDIHEVEGNETPPSNSGGNNEEEEEGEGVVMEQSPRMSSEVTNVKTSVLITLQKKNQLTCSKCTVSFGMTLGYFDLNNRFDRSITTKEEKDTSNIRECYTYPSSVSQSLLQPRDLQPRDLTDVIPAPPAAAASLNAYEYFWRKKPTVANIVNNSTIAKQCKEDKYYYNNKQVVVTTTTNGTETKATSTTKIATCTHNKASMNNLVPLLRSCKEPRRSLIIWEPYCIATS